MFFKVVTIFALVAVASAKPQHQEAARYPAGVDPAKCPGFPICDNAALHNPNSHNQWNQPAQHWNQPAAQQWNQPAQHWNQPAQQWNEPAAPQWNQWNNAPQVAAPASNHLPGAGGDKYPAGVNPQSCPNYPFCDNAHASHAPQVAPLPGWNERLYPAGVSPQSCPNFPYCH